MSGKENGRCKAWFLRGVKQHFREGLGYKVIGCLGGQLWRFRVRIPSLLYYWLTGVGYGGREGINILS